MHDNACARLEEPTAAVDSDGSPYYDIKQFPCAGSDATLTVVCDLAERLHEAVVRVQLAGAEGDPILSAWFPGARAALTEAGRWLRSHRGQAGGTR